jgi:hypothetical protein
MAAAYKVFSVTIPEDNGYASQPDMVRQRVQPHIKSIEPYAELTHVLGNRWKLTTPHLGAEMVARVLSVHYGFETQYTETVVK